MFNRLIIPKIGKCQRKAISSVSSASRATLTRQWASVRPVSLLQSASSLVSSLDCVWNPHLNHNLFAGVLFMCFTIDYRILHVKITPEATQDATHFYTLFHNAPPAIKVGLAFIHRGRVTYTVNRLTDVPSLDDGNRHRLFIGKTSPVG